MRFEIVLGLNNMEIRIPICRVSARSLSHEIITSFMWEESAHSVWVWSLRSLVVCGLLLRGLISPSFFLFWLCFLSGFNLLLLHDCNFILLNFKSCSWLITQWKVACVQIKERRWDFFMFQILRRWQRFESLFMFKGLELFGLLS